MRLPRSARERGSAADAWLDAAEAGRSAGGAARRLESGLISEIEVVSGAGVNFWDQGVPAAQPMLREALRVSPPRARR
jgi:hypothetical protein